MNIGQRIKERREQLNMSQDELAKKCGYKSRSSINKIETARSLPLSKVEVMAKALETTPADLMGWVVKDRSPALEELRAARDRRLRLQHYSELLENEELRKLLDAAKDCTTEQIKIATDMLKAFNVPKNARLRKEDKDG